MPSSNSDARKRHDEVAAFAPARDITSAFALALEQETTIIGLSGWAQSGKDSTANVMAQNFGFEKLAFAEKLRAVAREANPIVHVSRGAAPTVDGNDWRGLNMRADYVLDVAGYEWAKANTTYRDFLQMLGTAVRNHLGDTAWVDACLAAVEPGHKYVVTDVRFKNEADAIRARGGQVWRVKRAGHTAANDHISEHDLDDYDFDRVLSMPDYGDDLVQLGNAVFFQVGDLLRVSV